mmetsp:Transcript_47136/g.109375  ORF Transcript_47136/g.109375 Transcript_47136/m.109375 type:complete len:203 (+) Transcript_47136:83-691(+)
MCSDKGFFVATAFIFIHMHCVHCVSFRCTDSCSCRLGKGRQAAGLRRASAEQESGAYANVQQPKQQPSHHRLVPARRTLVRALVARLLLRSELHRERRHPLAAEQLLCRGAVERRDLQHRFDGRLRFARDALGEGVLEAQHGAHQLLEARRHEGQPAAKHLVASDSERPHVHRRAERPPPTHRIGAVAGELLGRSVRGGALA